MKAGASTMARPSGDGRLRRAAAWILPGALLLMMPKCPACLAAWIAIATGTGVSLTTAASLRTGLLIFSAGLLALMAVKTSCRLARRLPRSVKMPSPDRD